MNTIYVIGPDPALIVNPFARMKSKIGFVHHQSQLRVRLNEGKRWLGNDVKILHTFQYAGFDTPIHDFLRTKYRDICVFLPKNSAGRELVEFRRQDYDTIVNSIQRFINGGYQGKLHNFTLRQEQIDCIDKTVSFFLRSPHKSEFLWDAKMRFGKTHCTYLLAKKLGIKTILIITNRPTDTIDAWIDGLDHTDFDGLYNSVDFIKLVDTTLPIDFSLDKPRIIFSSTHLFDLSDVRWSSIINHPIGLLVKDESHLGTDTDRFLANLARLGYKHCLNLSGTPFKALLTGKFSNDSKYTWSYLDEQKARQYEINSLGEDVAAEKGQYYWLSPLRMFIMKLHEQMYDELAHFNEDEGFTFSKFFATPPNKAKFLNEVAVESFLDTLTEGRFMPFSRQASSQGYDPNNLRHTLWLLPGVDECDAMAKMLREHRFFKRFDVIVAAGDNEGENNATAELVHNAITKITINSSDAKGTITLTCGKLIHGVSIQQWGSVLNLSDKESSQQYFQFIFRIQTPYRDVKKECYVFDFSLNRTLKHLYKTARVRAADTNVSVADAFREMLQVFNPFYEGNAIKDRNINELIAEVNSFSSVPGMGGINSLVSRLSFDLTDDLIVGISAFAKTTVGSNRTVVSEDKGVPKGKNTTNGSSTSAGSKKEAKDEQLAEEEVRRALKVLLQTYLFLTEATDYDSLRATLQPNQPICERIVGLPIQVVGKLLDGFGAEERMDITEAITIFRVEEEKDRAAANQMAGMK